MQWRYGYNSTSGHRIPAQSGYLVYPHVKVLTANLGVVDWGWTPTRDKAFLYAHGVPRLSRLVSRYRGLLKYLST